MLEFVSNSVTILKKDLLLLFILLFTTNSFANVDCIWSSESKGIYMEYVASCDQENKFFVDSLLGQIVRELNRKDTQTKVEIYINSENVFYRETPNLNYIAISFDRLGKMTKFSVITMISKAIQ